MFTVGGARMHAGGATSTPQPPHGTTADRCAISRGRRLLVSHSGAIDFSAAWPDVRPHRRIGQTTSLADHWRLAAAGTLAQVHRRPATWSRVTHDNSPAPPLGIDEVAPWVL